MTKPLLLLVVLLFVYLYGWYHGVKWAKETIERKAGVRIESDLRIVPDAPPEARE